MSKVSEPASAFAVYSAKRKHAGTSFGNTKKIKKKQPQKIVEMSSPKQKKLIRPSTKKRVNKPSQRSANDSKPKKAGSGAIVKPLVQLRSKNKRKKTLRKAFEATKQKTNRRKVRVEKLREIKEIHEVLNSNKSSVKANQVPILGSDTKGMEDDSENPLITCRSMFNWLIHPMNYESFFENNWEKTPVHIKRNFPNYYKVLMSTAIMDKLLRESQILFTKNIDITSYENGVRATHNPPGRAMPSVVWDYYLNGCSVRMLNPQTYIPKLHALNATLQELFNCFVGANSYLTPPNSQGFAPHYDDIEAFILQVEGKKRWRLYKPLSKNEYLPRFSSKNYDQSEIGEPIFDAVVNAGDLLYFPRGTIHQGETLDDSHSLHITLSVYQKNSWGDFLEKLLPNTLRNAINTDSEYREGLPLDYLRYTGLVHSENESELKELFKEKIKRLCSKLIEYVDVDSAADSMAKSHMHDFLPPNLSESEQECSVILDGEQMFDGGVVKNRVEIEPDTRIRLLRSHCLRLIEEEGAIRLYYSTENSKEYHEYEPQFLEISSEFVPAVQEIILRYPSFVRVEDLPIDGEDNKIQIVKDLWEKCIVVTDNPLCILE